MARVRDNDSRHSRLDELEVFHHNHKKTSRVDMRVGATGVAIHFYEGNEKEYSVRMNYIDFVKFVNWMRHAKYLCRKRILG